MSLCAIVNATNDHALAPDINKHLESGSIELTIQEIPFHMSWLNDELPDEWPTRIDEEKDSHKLSTTEDGDDLSTSRSNTSSGSFGPTVAIQANVVHEKAAWRDAVKAPKSEENSTRLTQLFLSPPIPANKSPNEGQHANIKDDLSVQSDSNNLTTSTTSSLSMNTVPIDQQQRRLKVFGRPDTYTNELLGNLISSMGQHVTETSQSHTRDANTSDVDIAGNLQKEGRKVLQGLVPLRSSLQAVHEVDSIGIDSSLDELEHQLTQQGTTKGPNDKSIANSVEPSTRNQSANIDTTNSSLDSSKTLDSLPVGLSHWDIVGPSAHGQDKSESKLHKVSSQTLVGSGLRKKRSNEMDQLEAEISLLQIHEPCPQKPRKEQSKPFLSMEQRSFGTFSDDVQLSTSGRTSEVSSQQNGRHAEGSSSKSSGDMYFGQSNSIPTTSQHSSGGVTPPSSTPTRIRYHNRREHALTSKYRVPTPESIVNRFLQWPRPQRPPPRSPIVNSDVSKSIINKNVSFSAGYENLARLILEKISDNMDPTNLDSLDLSDCDLESIVGLDEFVPNITTLFLNDNNVRSLQGLPSQLVHLDMSSNNLSFMNTFPTCFVSTLILSHNNLRDLEPLANMKALSSLDISNNKLISLQGIENLTALRTLNVNDNQLKTLDLNLGMLSELSAARNQISSFRINSTNLEILDLEDNEIVAITEAMPNLRVFNMRFNDAVIDLAGFESLETALLDGNKAITNLETVAGNLVTFSWEQAKGKRSSAQLDTSLLTSCRDLNLGGYGSWPFSRNTIYSAQHLDLGLCNIRELPSNFTNQFPFLKSLNLAFNKLNDESYEVLASCSKLERLSLFCNRLDVIGEELARLLPSLRWLDSRNQRSLRLIKQGDFVSEVYSNFTEPKSQTMYMPDTAKTGLQWIDGEWTTQAFEAKPTTRPGFPSPLYPANWNPPVMSLASDETNEVSVISSLTAWDIVEAMYVHHYRK